MLGELAHAHDQLEGSMKSISAAGVEQLRAVEAKMGDLHESIESKFSAVRHSSPLAHRDQSGCTN